MGESDPRAGADDRSGPAILLDCRVARTIGFCSVLPSAAGAGFAQAWIGSGERVRRSEEHTSELQSQSNLVCRLLLEKKKRHYTITTIVVVVPNISTH